jgi:glycosyltransferase involved in cell wall biosynthesis
VTLRRVDGDKDRSMGSERLRIAFISPFLFRYARGIERFTISLANQLAALDQDVTLLTYGSRDQLPAPKIGDGVSVVSVPPIRYFAAQWAAPFYARALRRGRFDLVNVFFAGYGEASALRLAKRGSMIVNFIAGYPFEQVPHRFEEFSRSGLAARLDGIVVKSRFMAPAIESFFGRSVEVIPNGIDLDYFDPAKVNTKQVNQELKLSSEQKLLVTVAALETRKGILSVIDALPDVLSRGLDVRYVVVGEGQDRAVMEQRIAELALQERVTLVGTKLDVRPYLRAADLFLLPSRGEGFPNAFLEALAMELPVIVSTDPPYDEIMECAFGARVDQADSSALATTIAELLNDPIGRGCMGKAARAHVRDRYSWPSIARQYLQLFERQTAHRLEATRYHV